MGNGITEAQAGQAVDFREGPHENEVRLAAAADIGEQIEGIFEKLNVGFVQGQDDVFGDSVNEMAEFLRADGGASGVVRIGDEDHASVWGDRAEHGLKVMAVILCGD